MNILVFGWYGHGNVGDESFKIAFKQLYPQHNFTFTDNLTENHINLDYELCIVGGGDIINEHNLNQIIKLKCDKIAVSVTITKNSIANKTLLECIKFFYVRDTYSKQILNDAGYDNCEYIADIALVIKGDKIRGRKLIEDYFTSEGHDLYENVYAIVINAHLLSSSIVQTAKDRHMFDCFIDKIVEFIDNTNASFIFLPFSTKLPWDDRVTNALINSQCKWWKKNLVLYDKIAEMETIDILAACDSIITTRFHGLIYGLANKVPTSVISFHDKSSNFLKTIGHEYVDYYNFDPQKMKSHVANRIAEKEKQFLDIENELKKYHDIPYLNK